MYKATRADGFDFYTKTINYGKALETGQVVVHPTSQAIILKRPSTYLSTSTESAETLIGGHWPARLFRVEADAQAYIDDHLVPEGCWAGYSEGFGDWGVWELKEAAR
ncbi:hypothetical protein E0686_02665 [Deinococcus sp. S9]|nr:hypothetical protein E0686_02665 [Deinococcus sp. S9]